MKDPRKPEDTELRMYVIPSPNFPVLNSVLQPWGGCDVPANLQIELHIHRLIGLPVLLVHLAVPPQRFATLVSRSLSEEMTAESVDILQAQGIVPLDTVPVPPKRPGSSTDCGPSKPFKRLRTEQSPPQQGSGSQVKLEDTPTARELQVCL